MGIIVDQTANIELFNRLDKLKIKYCKSYNMDMLYQPINTHPDMQIHFISDTYAVVAPSAYRHYKSCLPDTIKLEKGFADPDGTYPGDCAYNVARIGNVAVGNMKYVDERIKEIYKAMGVRLISVKQGYAKCNLCVVGDNAAITEDKGLAKALSMYGIEILCINHGEIALRGFPYGFIGGASGNLIKNTILFAGNIEFHSECKRIISFLTQRKVDIINLSQTKLQDYGSLLYYKD